MTSKNYTHSRLKRVITYFAFGVEKVERAISFANLLCADKVGRGLIKAKKKDDFKIITVILPTLNIIRLIYLLVNQIF